VTDNGISFQQILTAALNTVRSQERDVQLLQVGANDGVSNDPIFEFVKEHIDSAAFVEPQPDAFRKLQENYADKPNFTFIKGVVFSHDTQMPMYRISPDKESEYKAIYKTHANASGVTSLDYNHVRNFLLKIAPAYFKDNDVEQWIETFDVEAMTFDTLLTKYDLAAVDILQVDAEGYDYEIVQMALSSNAISPLVINLEHKNLTDTQKSSIKSCLVDKNYSLYMHEGDLCAFKKIDLSL